MVVVFGHKLKNNHSEEKLTGTKPHKKKKIKNKQNSPALKARTFPLVFQISA